MAGRTAFELEDAPHRGRVLRVGAESIDGLGREGDELTVAQRLHGSLDLDLGSSDDTNHRFKEDSSKPPAPAPCMLQESISHRHLAARI